MPQPRQLIQAFIWGWLRGSQVPHHQGNRSIQACVVVVLWILDLHLKDACRIIAFQGARRRVFKPISHLLQGHTFIRRFNSLGWAYTNNYHKCIPNWSICILKSFFDTYPELTDLFSLSIQERPEWCCSALPPPPPPWTFKLGGGGGTCL